MERAMSVASLPEPVSTLQTTPYAWLITLFACIGSLLFGYNTGIVSSAMLFLADNPGMAPFTTMWQELIVGVITIASAVASLLCGKPADRLGRRPVIMAASLLSIIGAFVCGAAPEKWTLLAGRIILGVAVGFASVIVPIYISEASPRHMRGRFVTMSEISVAIGFIVANCISVGFAYVDPVKIGWRLMVGFSALPAAIQFIGFLFLHDTPRFLFKKGHITECETVLAKIYGDYEWARYDMEDIKDAVEREAQAKKAFVGQRAIVRVLATPFVRRALLVGCSLQIFQQLIGVNSILYYTGNIIQSAGVENKLTAIWMSSGVYLAQAGGALVTSGIIERMGRRTILLISTTGILVSLCLMGGSFLLINVESAPVMPLNVSDPSIPHFEFCTQLSNCDSCVTSSHCGFCHLAKDDSTGFCLPANPRAPHKSIVGVCDGQPRDEEYRYVRTFCRSKYTWLPIAVMIIYILAFAFGIGPLAWVYNAEIYPLWARSTCVSIATFTNWIVNLVISLTFLTLNETITKYGTFFLYTFFALLAIVIFYFFVPETLGVDYEDIGDLFKSEDEKRLDKQQLTPYEAPVKETST